MPSSHLQPLREMPVSGSCPSRQHECRVPNGQMREAERANVEMTRCCELCVPDSHPKALRD